MDDSVLVRILQGSQSLAGVSYSAAPWHGSRLDPLGGGFAGDELRRHHQLAFNFPGVVESHDIGMNQPRVNLDFPQKPGNLLFVILKTLGQYLKNFETLRENVSDLISH